MNRTLLSSSGLLVAIVLFFAINIISMISLKSARFDFTDNHIYTLSEGTKNILQKLDEPITLRFYFSRTLANSLPSIKSYAQRVEELLAEFSLHAKGKLKLEILEPEAFSDEEDRAVGYGLQGVALDASNTKFYFGLVGINSVDEEGVIPFFQTNRQNFLEYDLARLIYSLSGQKKKVIGLLSTLPINQPGQDAWVVMEQINQQFEVKTLETTTKSLDNIDVLMLVHPQGLSEETLFAIDQFVLGGGYALIFIDPYAEAQGADSRDPMAALTMKRSSDLGPLMAAWGVEMVAGKVVADRIHAHEVRYAAQPGQSTLVNYLIWLGIGQDRLDTEDVITAELETLNLATVGALQATAGATTTLTPLVKSSDQTMLMDAAQLAFTQDPAALLKAFKSENQVRNLAVRITGTAKTAYPKGRPQAIPSADSSADKKPDAPATPPVLTESKQPINLVMVADTDLLQDKFWVQVQNFFGQRVAIPSASNGTLVVNALDNLTGSQDLISVRSRGSFSRPFNRVKAIKREAEQQYRETEQALQQRLEQTETRLNELQKTKTGGNAAILSDAQKQEILQFREEQVRVRKQLRDVQHQLSKNIDRLEAQVKVINIILIPFFVAVLGFYNLIRLRARRQRAITATQ